MIDELKAIRGTLDRVLVDGLDRLAPLIAALLAGRLTHMLPIMIGSIRDHEVEQPLDALEAALAERSGGRFGGASTVRAWHGRLPAVLSSAEVERLSVRCPWPPSP